MKLIMSNLWMVVMEGKKTVLKTSRSILIVFFTILRCYGYYGMSTGAQDLSIGGGCGTVGTVLHEMMHTLGFVHEHQRFRFFHLHLFFVSYITHVNKFKGQTEMNMLQFKQQISKLVNFLYY